MTAVESHNNDALLRPTDLSLKGCLNNKFSKQTSNTPSPNQLPLPLINDQKLPYLREQQWRSKVKAEPVTMPSPMTLTYATPGATTSMAPALPMDSVTSLVMLESFLKQYHRYSPPISYDSRAAQNAQRSRNGSNSSSNDKIPISQPLLDAAKGMRQNSIIMSLCTYNFVILPTKNYSN